MNLSQQQAMRIVSDYFQNNIELQSGFNLELDNVTGYQAWVIEKQLNSDSDIPHYYVVSDNTGELEYTTDDWALATQLNCQQALDIAQAYSACYNQQDRLKRPIQLNSRFGVTGDIAWIITAEFLLFADQLHERWYVISDETGQVEYILTEHGAKVTPHLTNK